MSLSQKIAQNTVIQILSKIIATVLGLATLAIMTRYLGKAGFGEYTTIITFLSFFAIIADFGLTLVTTQMISQPQAEENRIINNLLTLRLLSVIFFIALGPIIVSFFPYSHNIKIGILLTSLSFVFVALNQILVGLFQKKLSMNRVALAEIVSRVILLLGIITVTLINRGLIAILWVTVISSVVNFLIQFAAAKKFVRLRFAFDWPIWHQAIQKSWPLALTIIFNLIYLKTDTILLSLYKTQEEVGIYGSAYKIIDVLVSVPFMFAGIILPILTSSWAQKNFDYFKGILQRSFDFMIILAVPIIFGVQLIAKEIMTLVAGPKFIEAGPVLQILIGASSLIFLSCLFAHAIIAIDQVKKIIGAYVFTSLTALAGYLIFIPKYSYIGAAWVTIYSELVIAIFMVYYVYRFTKFKPSLKLFGKSLLASIIMTLAIYLIPHHLYNSITGLTMTVVTATSVYFISLYFLKGLSQEDFKLFWPLKKTE